MRIMLVADKPDLEDYVKSLVDNDNDFVVHYQHPLKALDNLGELRPHLIIWDLNDFPRHWKVCASWCNSSEDMRDTKMILVSETGLTADERKKTEFFEQTHLVEGDYFSDAFSEAFAKYIGTVTPAPAAPRQSFTSPKYLSLMFIHVPSGQIVIGTVLETQNNCILVDLDAYDYPLFQNQVEKTIFPHARGITKDGGVPLRLQFLEKGEKQTIRLVCI